MRYTTKTEYAILCMVYLAKHPKAECVTIKELAKSERYPAAYLEKILQTLRQAGLVVSHHGNQGGYELARPSSEITLRDIIQAVEGETFEIFCQPEVREDIVCTHFCLCGVKPVWRTTKGLLDRFFAGITLDMLTRNEIEVQGLLGSSMKAALAEVSR
ncbi:MAG: HTH-type transcriptional regulator IscR [Candidatus Omnitrophica bacterium]|nr:HTH-type transcriptional regulator IscR [Candidatus Omnitrophota bacterium]